MKKSLVLCVLAASAAAALTFSSCIIAVMETSDPSVLRGWGEFRQVVLFQRGGTVMLENNRGNVEVYGWEKNEVEVVARYEGRFLKPGFTWFGYYRWHGSQPSVVVDSLDDQLKIRMQDDEGEESGVTFKLNVPRSVNIAALRIREGDVLLSGLYGKAVIDLRQGDVRVENCSGSFDITLGRGTAEVELLDLRRGDDVKITVDSGDIVLSLDQAVSAQVEASSGLNRVASEFDLGQKLPASQVKGKLKDGWAMISLSVARGSVELKKIKD